MNLQNSIILIDKPAGWTSFDVVAKIRGKIRANYHSQGVKPTKRQLKVGHAGTLDPFATGLLIVLVGDATKKSNQFLKMDKTYQATIKLGQTSTTGDPEGEIKDGFLSPTSVPPSKESVQDVLKQFCGKVMQRPPAFSAIKVDGKRAYKLAREGKPVDIPEREITIHYIELLDYQYPELKIETSVSSGTYIRSLAEDIGKQLGTGAYCRQLRRTQVGDWVIGDAKSINHVGDDL